MATIRVANAQLWVHDQDEALEFWTKKVGFEVAPGHHDGRSSATSAGSRSERPGTGLLDRPDGDSRARR